MTLSLLPRGWRLALAVGACAAGLAGAARAEFPERPVTIVVPFSPGSGTDTGTRVLSGILEPILGQPVIVDNRPGGNGALGASVAAQAAADGYTLFMGTNTTQSANPLLMKNLSYDPARDFIPIGLVATFEALLAVRADFPAQTTEELIEYVRAHPGDVTYGTGNVTGLVMATLFLDSLGLDMVRVPFKSNAEALTGMLGGQIDVMFPDIASSMPYVKSGALRALASVTLGDVTPLAPDLKPLSQTLVPDMKIVGWIGLFAPAGTPDDVVKTLSAALEKAVGDPVFVEKLHAAGANAGFLAAADLDAQIAAERESFAAIFKKVGMEAQ